MGLLSLFAEVDLLLHMPDTVERIESKIDSLLGSNLNLHKKVNTLMGMVKVQQEALDEIDRQLDESTAAIEQKLTALDLPEADLAPIMEDLNNLKGLHATDAPTEPLPDDGSGTPDDGAHVDNTLPGDLPHPEQQ